MRFRYLLALLPEALAVAWIFWSLDEPTSDQLVEPVWIFVASMVALIVTALVVERARFRALVPFGVGMLGWLLLLGAIVVWAVVAAPPGGSEGQTMVIMLVVVACACLGIMCVTFLVVLGGCALVRRALERGEAKLRSG